MNQLRKMLLVAAMTASSPALADGGIEDLASMMAGRFDTATATTAEQTDTRLVDMRMRVEAPALGDIVFYQQINQKKDLEVYRQRILVLSVADGRIVQHAYAFQQPEWYVDADANVFGSLTMDDLDAFMPDGCEMVWSPMENGFKGHVDPAKCEVISSRTGKPRQIEAEALLTPAAHSLAERGFDPESGEQLFGTNPGEYLKLGRESE